MNKIQKRKEEIDKLINEYYEEFKGGVDRLIVIQRIFQKGIEFAKKKSEIPTSEEVFKKRHKRMKTFRKEMSR